MCQVTYKNTHNTLQIILTIKGRHNKVEIHTKTDEQTDRTEQFQIKTVCPF